MSHIATGHTRASVAWRAIPNLVLPPGAEALVVADVDGAQQTHPVRLAELTARLAQLPRTARNVAVHWPAPATTAELAARRRVREARRLRGVS